MKIASINSFDGFFCCWTRHYYHLSYPVVGKWDSISATATSSTTIISTAIEGEKKKSKPKWMYGQIERVRRKVFVFLSLDGCMNISLFTCVLRLLECFDPRKFNSPIEMLVEQSVLCRDTDTDIRAHTRENKERKKTENFIQEERRKNIIGLMNVRHSDIVQATGAHTRAKKQTRWKESWRKSTRQRKNSNEKGER